MIAQHTEQHFDAQGLEIGDITRKEGAIDLGIEIQFGLPLEESLILAAKITANRIPV